MTSQSVNLQYDRDKNEYIPILKQTQTQYNTCLLYTSDAADE